MKHLTSLFTVLIMLLSLNAQAEYSERADVQQFIDEMVDKHDFDRDELVAKLASAEKLEGVLKAIARPAEKVLTWEDYRPIFVTSKRIDKGNKFLQQHREILQRAEKEYGVPAQIIAAIVGVETYYGTRSGRTNVFNSLVTLAFDYPPRSPFFRSELEQFLLLTREEDVDVNNVRGSYAGAMGMPQFISSSYRHYAVDFDGDGKRDLWNSTADVVGSVANYFREHGWEPGDEVVIPARVNAQIEETRNKLKPHTLISELSRQGVYPQMHMNEDVKATVLTLHGKNGKEYWLGLDNFYVITRYNHSAMYAMAVYQLSLEFDTQK
ncbi:MAG: lytic murein transglycosylase B [Gammaproteobacteria bacterium]|nr:lytic murein transglycosylase B [Gammaproteobacteria bacterium]